uniref:ELKS/RAB6-interacting/CAST family member 1 n=1 Tax=Oryzias melastigma TaxID=30732 RepID=A0A3B3DB40_ORYME
MYGSSRSVSKLDVVGSNGNGSASGSPGRSPRLPRSPRLAHRRNSSSSSAGGLTGSGKTLSMENIQSLNAAYATGGPMYFSDAAEDPAGIGSLSGGLNPTMPKNTMTLGRAGARVPYGVRAAVMGSSPNINTGGGVGTSGAVMPSDAIAFGDLQNQPPQAATVPHSMRQFDGQLYLSLTQQLEGKESKLSSSMNSIKTFWSPELKKERALRKDEATKIGVWKEQYRVVQEETQVDALRLRLEEKEALLSKKSQQISELTEEKSTQQGEISDLKDMLDVKERKVNVLQKKIENLLDQLRDKEKQLSGLKDRVKSLQTDTSNTDTALGTLEEALSEKERIIERLKEQREKEEREKGDEMESSKKDLKEFREKVSQLQADLADREALVLDLKEKASSLASSNLKKDSRLKSLEIGLEQKKEECNKLENQLKKAQSAAAESRANAELSERITCLEQEVTRHREDAGKAQSEVERLLEILREMENEKNDKEKKIHELERQMKDQSKRVASMKHKEQLEKSRNAQLMEEAKKREDNLNESSQQFKDSLRHKEDRIEELEEALRESVQITAEREVVLAQEEQARTQAEKQVEDLLVAMEKVKQELEVMKAKLSSTQLSLAEKEGHLTALRAERRKHLEEVLEMKQETLLAAISEKDANIALLELSSSKKKKTQEEVAALKREKDSLVQQLKQQTQNRMKLMADNYEDDHLKVASPNSELPNNHKPSPDQDDEEGIWA